MSVLLKTPLTRSECRRLSSEFSRGGKPAVTGVGGLGGRGDFTSGRGSEAVLSLASMAFMSRWLVGRFGGCAGVGTVDPEDEVGREGGRFCLRGVPGESIGGEPLGSGALVTRPPSLVVRLALFA